MGKKNRKTEKTPEKGLVSKEKRTITPKGWKEKEDGRL